MSAIQPERTRHSHSHSRGSLNLSLRYEGQVTLVHFAPAWRCLQLGNFMLHRLTGKLSGICQEFLEVGDRFVCWQSAFFLGGGRRGDRVTCLNLCCYNKNPRPGGLQRTNIYFLQFWGIESPISRCPRAESLGKSCLLLPGWHLVACLLP